MDKSWCEGCFNCAKCGKSIASNAAGGEFKIEDGQPVCEACREMVFCAACGLEIEESALTAMDKNWHLDCFKCSKCSKVCWHAGVHAVLFFAEARSCTDRATRGDM